MTDPRRFVPAGAQPPPPFPHSSLGAGWILAFTANGSRLVEAADLYEELGFEVRLVPVAAGILPTDRDPLLRPPVSPECAGCLAAQAGGAAGPVRAIYIRPKDGEHPHPGHHQSSPDDPDERRSP